jgi:glucosamine--fructose-6-phosphate aminotransferase (isomerizing)
MCGIVGIIGQLEAAPRILDALRRLEYRGYDSAGLTVLENGVASRRRAVGKLSALVAEVARAPVHGTVGIGHTRWATHGAPTVENAHPHAAGPVHVVHNGIIENFRELRAELGAAGVTCETETDTEVVAHLVAAGIARGLDPFAAVSEVLPRLEGAFALVVLVDGHPDELVVARHGSPLAIGWGEEEMYVGSDALALGPLTSRITYLEEGDHALVTRAGARIFDLSGAEVARPVRSVAVDPAQLDRGSHRHFMAKEIHEQPAVASHALARYVAPGRRRIASPAEAFDWEGMSRLFLVGCGTAAYAGRVAKYWFEELAGLPVEADIASEFRYRAAPVEGREGALFISQSGETADTLAAMRHLAGRLPARGALVNVPESTIAREAEIVLPIEAGPEIGVASTKAFTAMLTVLASTALLAGRRRGRIGAEREAALLEALLALPRLLADTLRIEREAQAIAREIHTVPDVLYLGRGPLFPIALEGALKLKEISYIHAEGYASGELKHGPIALVDSGTPVVVIAPRDALFAKTVSNMQEVMARGARVILVTDPAGAAEAGDGAWRTLTVPEADPFIQPILHAVPAQLLAYFTAVAKGTDVDQPRNLAKSVTVE